MNTSRLGRILLVEDEADIRVVAKRALELLGGFTVETCAGGREAARRALGFGPDLILLDVMMPGMDGPATLRTLQDCPGLMDIPVIFMTARVQSAEVEEYRALGAIDVIAKPFNAVTLASTVKSIWEAHARMAG